MTDLPGGEQNRSRFKAMWRVLSDWVRAFRVHGGMLRRTGNRAYRPRRAHEPGRSPGRRQAGTWAANLLLERMAVLDLDPAEVAQVGPQTFRDLQRVCSLCESKRRCTRDLAHDATAPRWEDYCPNAQTLMALDVLPWASRREW